MFTLEIAGKPVAVIDASRETAEESFHEEKFLSRLQMLKTKDGPIWDGRADLVVRPATEDEISAFDEVDESLDPESDESDQDEADEDEDEENAPFIVLLPSTDNAK
jgi:hypothetical protein